MNFIKCSLFIGLLMAPCTAMGYTLSEAIGNGDVRAVETFIRNGADVNASDAKNGLPLHWAAYKGNADIVKLLIDAQAEINKRENFGATALIVASVVGRTAAAKLLIAENADVNLTNSGGDTALIAAARRGHAGIVELLIGAKADLNAKNDSGYTALMEARRAGHSDVVKLLTDSKAGDATVKSPSLTYNGLAGDFGMELVDAVYKQNIKDIETFITYIENGANINAKNKDGVTALMAAVERRDLDLVKRLIGLKADVNAMDKWGGTALKRAIQRENYEIAKLLIDAGIDANAKNEALISAAKRGLAEVVKPIIFSKADVNVRDGEGFTALMHALWYASEYDPDTVKRLVSAGADVNIKSHAAQYTALMFAATNNNAEAVKLLIDAGADVNAVSSNGETALLMSARSRQGDHETVKCLIDAKADVNVKDQQGNTAYINAIEAGNSDAVRLLLDAGADTDVEEQPQGLINTMFSSYAGYLFDTGSGARSILIFEVSEGRCEWVLIDINTKKKKVFHQTKSKPSCLVWDSVNRRFIYVEDNGVYEFCLAKARLGKLAELPKEPDGMRNGESNPRHVETRLVISKGKIVAFCLVEMMDDDLIRDENGGLIYDADQNYKFKYDGKIYDAPIIGAPYLGKAYEITDGRAALLKKSATGWEACDSWGFSVLECDYPKDEGIMPFMVY